MNSARPPGGIPIWLRHSALFAATPFVFTGTPSRATIPSCCGACLYKNSKFRYVMAEPFSTRHNWRSSGFILMTAVG